MSPIRSDGPVTVICWFRVKAGEEARFRDLQRRHWPTLRDLKLATDVPARAFRGADAEGRPFIVEIFEWASEAAVERAHQHPEVMAIWEPMDPLCEPRDGRPSMEFHHVEPVSL